MSNDVRAIFIAVIIAFLAFAALTFPLPSQVVFHVLNAVVLATACVVFYAYLPALIDMWRTVKGTQANHEFLADVVEEQLGEQMIVQARIVAAYVAAAERCGMPPEQINKCLKQITDTTALDEIWVTDEKGDAYLTNTGIPFSFNKSSTLQPQAHAFWPLLLDETDHVVQKARKREIDDNWFKYAGVQGVDKPRIVQVGFSWPYVERLRATFGVGPGLSAGHLLTFGIMVNWLGFIGRLGRWYISGAHPTESYELWFYNIGLWVSVVGGWLLTGAVAANNWSGRKWLAVVGAWCVISAILMMITYSTDPGFMLEAAPGLHAPPP